MAIDSVKYFADQKTYSGQTVDIVDKLLVDITNYNLTGKYLNSSKDSLSELIDECVKYAVFNPSLSSKIQSLAITHFNRPEYLKFLTVWGKYSSTNNTQILQTRSTPLINRMSPETLLTKMTR